MRSAIKHLEKLLADYQNPNLQMRKLVSKLRFEVSVKYTADIDEAVRLSCVPTLKAHLTPFLDKYNVSLSFFHMYAILFS